MTISLYVQNNTSDLIEYTKNHSLIFFLYFSLVILNNVLDDELPKIFNPNCYNCDQIPKQESNNVELYQPFKSHLYTNCPLLHFLSKMFVFMRNA